MNPDFMHAGGSDAVPTWMLQEDGGRLVCRASGHAMGIDAPSVLVVAAEGAAARDRLVQEFALEGLLDARWAVRPLKLSHDPDRTVLILEDPGGEPLTRLLGAPMPLPRFLRLADHLAAAVRGLHSRGLVHKDLRPSNVLVSDAPQTAVRLTGFGLASRVQRERAPPAQPGYSAGVLPYLAPEQTGRMNRSIDSRTDLYALGVIFYEMLVGALPFAASDPMAWIHAHVARMPIPPADRRGDIPSVVSDLVMKLLAKSAEDRYQTAAGLEHDLRRLRSAWESEGRVETMALAASDVPDRLLIPERLYGRTRETGILREALRQVATTGVPAWVLVSGPAGAGKSSVVEELQRALIPFRGHFACGRFDPDRLDVPHAALAQAFRGVVRHILAKPEAELEDWRNALRAALGPNARLIVEFIPELELVIGPQPVVAELPPQAARRRFHAALKRFVGVFARPGQPMILFLDDLQWSDGATLEVLAELVDRGGIPHLLLIGACRDDGTGTPEALKQGLEALRRGDAQVIDVVLDPLGENDLAELVAESLHSADPAATSLARLVHGKTGGNPFFARAFLGALADAALLVFDHDAAAWSWDIDRIRARPLSDNVIDLIAAGLVRLPGATVITVRLLACIGARAEFALLATLCDTSEHALHETLGEAVRAGVVVRETGAYAFQHDRIREAARSLVPEDERAATQLRIGRLLLDRTPENQRADAIFEIVTPMNLGAALIASRDERTLLAGLNLIAGRRARDAGAHASARTYLAAGLDLLADDRWTRTPGLAFELELGLAECELLGGVPLLADERLAMLANRAATVVHDAAVTCLRIDLYLLLARSTRALEVGLDYLRRHGLPLSSLPSEAEVCAEYERIWQGLGRRRIEDLADLPAMEDAGCLATIEVLNKLVVSAIYQHPALHRLLLAQLVNVSMAHGNSAASCVGYAWLGRVLASEPGQHDAARRFGQVALALVERQGLEGFRARVLLIVGSGISPWVEHLAAGRALLARTVEEADRIGDPLYIGLARSNLAGNLISSGVRLADADRAAMEGLEFARGTGSQIVIAYMIGQLRLIRSLRGVPCDVGGIAGGPFDAAQFEHHLASDPTLEIARSLYWSRRVQALVFMGEHAAALEIADRAASLPQATSPNIERAERCLYSALALAQAAAPLPSRLEGLRERHDQLAAWARVCPANFECRAALVGAELARLEDRVVDAEHRYELAVRSARANGFLQIEALACETAGRFFAARGLDDIATSYATRARDTYRRWGADAKVLQLSARCTRPDENNGLGSHQAPPTADPALDVAAVLTASQALSGEMQLCRLIDRLMTIAVQNAGADRGVLILARPDAHAVAAEARTSAAGIEVRTEASADAAVPDAIVRYVMRTHETVIVDDAARTHPFAEDPYLAATGVRSVLCLPLVRQGVLGGLLYLENRLATHVFTAERTMVLELLASQAAISLENSRLVADLREREARVRRLFNANIIGIFTWHLDGRILDANEAFLRIVGYDADDLASGRMRWLDLEPGRYTGDDEIMKEMLATGVAPPFEDTYLRKDGRRVPVLLGAALFDGAPSEGVAFVIDLTDRQRAEQLVLDSERRYHDIELQLAHANRVATMGQLSASIAHELNQPLAGLVLSADTALRILDAEAPDFAEVRRGLARIARDGKRAGEVFRRILALAKKAPPQRDSVPINDVVLEIAGLTQGEASRRHVRIVPQLQTALPTVSGDRVQLQQVTLNLVMNALEAFAVDAAGPRTIEIRTSLTASGDVQVEVRDSGPGIATPDVERLFEAFYTTKATGLGMGLSICRSIIQSHGGRLWATPNDDGPGASFRFSLPR